MVSELAIELQISVFDSFYKLLPEGFSVDLPSCSARNIFLLELGIIINFKFEILSKTTIRAIETTASFEEASVSELGANSIVKVSGHESFRLINNAAVYYSEYADNKASLTKAVFADEISLALNEIAYTDSDLKSIIDGGLNHIVLLPEGNRLSFTDSRLPKTIFISYASYEGDRFLLAATIIHEFSHLEFSDFLNCIKFNHEDGILHYSPWRNDPRPLHGLIHGTYVFTAMFRFFSLAKNRLGPKALEIRALIYYQLRFVHTYVSSLKILTPAGQSVINELFEILEQFAQEDFKHIEEPVYLEIHRRRYGNASKLTLGR